MAQNLRSPKEAAEYIWGFIEEQSNAYQLTDWDVLCFSVLFLAKMSQVPSYSYLQPAAKDAGRLLWAAFEYLDTQQSVTPEPEGNGPKSLFESDGVRRSGSES